MEPSVVLQAAFGVMAILGQKGNLTEYEVLAYEQACRTIEVLLKSHRELWEKHFGELENPTE